VYLILLPVGKRDVEFQTASSLFTFFWIQELKTVLPKKKTLTKQHTE